MCLDDRSHDRQSEADAFLGSVASRAMEGLKEQALVPTRYSRAAVRHCHPNQLGPGLDDELDRAPIVRVLAGVADQIHQDLTDAAGVGDELGDEALHRDLEPLALLLQQGRYDRLDFRDDVFKRHRLAVDLEMAIADSGSAQQVLDEPVEPESPAMHRGNHVAHLISRKSVEVLDEQLRRSYQ